MFKTKKPLIMARLALFVLLALAVAGCSVTKHLYKDDESIDLSENSLLLMKISAENAVAPKFEPEIKVIQIIHAQSGKKHSLYFTSSEKDRGKNVIHHWLAVYLPAGDYRVQEIEGEAQGEILKGTFLFEPGLRFSLPPNKIVYGGSIRMVNRERDKELDEPRAGSMFPLIDQAAAGFHKGTFDFFIRDVSADVQTFRERLPLLSGREIETALATQ